MTGQAGPARLGREPGPAARGPVPAAACFPLASRRADAAVIEAERVGAAL